MSLIATCAGALTLRRLALTLLGADTVSLDDRAIAGLQRTSVRSWGLFLAEEGCAAVVMRHLKVAGIFDALPSGVQTTVETRALAEAQRVLAASGQLRHMARIAERRQWTVVVLKGGVAVGEGADPLYLGDIDVLLRDEHLLELASELRATGYAGGEEGGMYHLEPSLIESGIPIEIHRRWDRDADRVAPDWWTRVITLERFAPLRRPGAGDHLWHLLLHCAEHHSELRGRLRDLLLIAAAMRAQSPSLQEQIARHPAHGAMTALLRMAGAFATVRESEYPRLGTANVTDAFERRAAGRYLLRAVMERHPVPALLRGQLIGLTLSLLDGPAELQYYVRRVLPTIWRASLGAPRGPFALRLAAAPLRIIRRAIAQIIVALTAPVLVALAKRVFARSHRDAILPV